MQHDVMGVIFGTEMFLVSGSGVVERACVGILLSRLRYCSARGSLFGRRVTTSIRSFTSYEDQFFMQFPAILVDISL